MRRLALIVVLLSLPAHGVVNCFASAAFSSNSGSSTSINTTGATLLVAVTNADVFPALVTDSANNTWQFASLYSGIVYTNLLISYVPNPITSASHTFSFRRFAGSFTSGIFYACSGTDTIYPLRSQNGLFTASSGTFQTGSVTPQAGDLVVAGAATSQFPLSTFSASIDSGFSTPIINTAACCTMSAAAILVPGTGSPVNPAWTMSANSGWAAVIAVFRAAGAPAPTVSGMKINKLVGDGSPPVNGFSGDGGPAISAGMYWPGEMVFDSHGSLCFADVNDNRIRCVNNQGTTQTLYNVSVCAGCIQTIAGNGTLGFSGDGGAATSAELAHPVGMAIDSSDNLYTADQQNHRIRKITTGGTISTVAGSGASTNGSCTNGSFSGDGGPATSATIDCPQGVAIDANGNIVVSDSSYRLRIVNTQGTTQSLFGVSVCSGCIQTFYGNGNPAIIYPIGTAFGPSGSLYAADYQNSNIVKITSAGVASIIAGNGTAGYSGDGGPATSAMLNHPYDVKVDAAGNVDIADTYNALIRRVTAGGDDLHAGGQFLIVRTQRNR